MRIIAITNQKGGSGKTTTAINLSAALAHRGKKVLLVDMDPQANATLGLNEKNIQFEKTVYNILVGGPPVPIDEVIVELGPNLHIVPASIELSGAELELANEIGRETRLSHALSGMKKEYDYVIIDCSPSLGLLTFNSLVASDEALVTVEMSFFALQGVGKLLQIIDVIRERLDHPISFCALATIFDRRNKLSREVLENMRETFGGRALKTVIEINVKLKEAASKGVDILKYDKKSRGAQNYLALAKEILAQEKPNAVIKKAAESVNA